MIKMSRTVGKFIIGATEAVIGGAAITVAGMAVGNFIAKRNGIEIRMIATDTETGHVIADTAEIKEDMNLSVKRKAKNKLKSIVDSVLD